ncbi:arsenate reductase ArsC [Phenylobacterium sp.]|jgi:arsenate reductase|uniref:arsenate reductase ArsC n=1 Tax=Phenylobacterium sp. TaxID=1871053 RepID=UPI002F400AB8
MPDTPYNVLFLCTGNSARSIIAEALMTRLGRGRFKAFSAGSFPKGQINPYAVPVVESLGFQAADFRSKSWDEFARPGAPPLEFVFTVCDDAAGEVCPVWPGKPMTAHWGMPDPAAATGTPAEIAVAFGEACRQLRNRISIFVELPLASLDRLSLQNRLTEIGAMPDAPGR